MGAVAYTMLDRPAAGRTGDSAAAEAFVAVYAGKTEAEARAVLTKAWAHFPGSTVRRMRVSYSRIVQ
jgi:Xaa-Pro aminopeptidase